MSGQETTVQPSEGLREAFDEFKQSFQKFEETTSQHIAQASSPHSSPFLSGSVEIVYIVAIVLFILGLKKMSSPVTARGGIVWAGVGMLIATIVTFVHPQIIAHANMTNYLLMIIAVVLGSAVAWWVARKVAMTDMPQMIAIYNGMGGGAAAAIAAV